MDISSMRGVLAIIVCLCFPAISLAAAFADDQRVVEIVSVRGGATYSLYDKMGELRPGMKIPVNSAVRTDSSGEAIIKFFDGTRLEIEPDSEVFLIDFANNPKDEAAIFTLQSGIAKVNPGDPSRRRERPLVVHTPQARINAGGSSLLIQARDGKNHIYADTLSDGGVVVRDKIHGGELEILQDGEIATIAPPDAGECSASSCILRRAKAKKPKS